MNLWWLLVGGSYLLGSLSSAHLVGWLVGRNPSKEGSKNPGATNILRIAGYKAAVVVLAGDILKGAVPTIVALVLSERYIALACGAAAVLGHIFPVFLKFKGGKGVATYGGMLICLNPFVALIAVGCWILILLATRLGSLASIVGISLTVLGVGLRDREIWEIATAAGLVLLITLRHYENIKRLLQGEEKQLRFSSKSSSSKDPSEDTTRDKEKKRDNESEKETDT